MDLHIEVGPHLLGLPEIMRPAVEMRRRRPAGDQFGVESLRPQFDAGRLVARRHDLALVGMGRHLVEGR